MIGWLLFPGTQGKPQGSRCIRIFIRIIEALQARQIEIGLSDVF